MMKALFNYFRKRRLFRDRKCLKHFIHENMKNKLAGYVLEVSIIRHYMANGNKQEVANRSKNLRMDGLNPPTTQKKCDRMINDLKRWYL